MRTHGLTQLDTSEPVGIVIADGGSGAVISRLAAFVWGPVPDDDSFDDLGPASADEGAELAAVA